jgi:uncharacterized protein
MRFVTIILMGAAIAYGVAVGGLYGMQRQLQYYQTTQYLPPSALNNLPKGVEEVRLKTSDGETVFAWHLPAKAGKRTILFFPGNAGHLPFMTDRFRAAARLGLGLMAMSYRGYSGSSGSPTEEGLARDAEAGYAHLATKVPAREIILHGVGLGGAVAARLALKQPARELVLEATYPSSLDVIARRFWFAPMPYLLEDKYLTRDIIRDIRMPILFVHGEKDEVVPVSDGAALHALARQPKQWFLIPSGTHNNLSELGLYEAILAFAEASGT